MEHSTPQIYTEFLPISRADMEARGWEQLDFVVVGGDAYVDHPSFGTDRKSTRLNSSHPPESRMPSSA